VTHIPLYKVAPKIGTYLKIILKIGAYLKIILKIGTYLKIILKISFLVRVLHYCSSRRGAAELVQQT
jgi:hypothetical protein